MGIKEERTQGFIAIMLLLLFVCGLTLIIYRNGLRSVTGTDNHGEQTPGLSSIGHIAGGDKATGQHTGDKEPC